MQSKEENNLILVRLFTDEDIHESLKKACQKHKVQTAVVTCGLGQVKQCTLGYFKEKGNYTPQKFEKVHELLSLNGIISYQEGDYNLHLHAIIGNEEKQAFGGHLLEGKVQVTNEIALLKSGMKVARKMNEQTGLQGLFLEG